MPEEVRVGVAGIGFMGRMHFGIYRDNPRSRVTAVADTDTRKLAGDWGDIGGNIGDGGDEKADLSGLNAYSRIDELIDDPNVDLVDITLPTYMHAEYALKALSAGKHVLCEKPIANKLVDAERVVAAAAEAEGKLMVAHCIRFWPEYAWVKKHVAEDREYGEVLTAGFRRLSATPAWSWNNWIVDPEKRGDAAMELHVHDVDFIRYLFGDPEQVWAAGAVGAVSGGGVDHIFAQYRYPGVKQVSAEAGWELAPGFGFEMSFVIACEGATVSYSSARTPALVVHLSGGTTVVPEVAAGDGYGREIDYFLDCILRDRSPTVMTGEEALSSLALCLREIESVRAGGRWLKLCGAGGDPAGASEMHNARPGL